MLSIFHFHLKGKKCCHITCIVDWNSHSNLKYYWFGNEKSYVLSFIRYLIFSSRALDIYNIPKYDFFYLNSFSRYWNMIVKWYWNQLFNLIQYMLIAFCFNHLPVCKMVFHVIETLFDERLNNLSKISVFDTFHMTQLKKSTKN